MGLVYENITLTNTIDLGFFNRGVIKKSEVRKKQVQAMVDTGAYTLVITDEVRQDLGLAVEREKLVRMANKTSEMCKVTEPVTIQWNNRTSVTQAIILPGTSEVLLGAIPLEEMDVMVDPYNQKLVGVHGDEIIHKVY